MFTGIVSYATTGCPIYPIRGQIIIQTATSLRGSVRSCEHISVHRTSRVGLDGALQPRRFHQHALNSSRLGSGVSVINDKIDQHMKIRSQQIYHCTCFRDI
jgi:hypothetical protein